MWTANIANSEVSHVHNNAMSNKQKHLILWKKYLETIPYMMHTYI